LYIPTCGWSQSLNWGNSLPIRRGGRDWPACRRQALGEGELGKESNMQKMHIANSDKPVALYNLEVVISLFFFFIAQRPTAAGRTPSRKEI
jgi:hypothetical protein